MRKVLLIILLSIGVYTANAQISAALVIAIADAQSLSTSNKRIDNSMIFCYRTWGSNQNGIYYCLSGTATGGNMGMSNDTLQMLKNQHYIIQRDSGLTTAYFYTTIKIPNPVNNIPDFYSKLQAWLTMQGLTVTQLQLTATQALIAAKANASDLVATNTVVAGKASQSDLNTTNSNVSANTTAILSKASTATVTALQTIVGRKIDSATVITLVNGKLSNGTTTTGIAEGTNKYYTDARVLSYIQAHAAITGMGSGSFTGSLLAGSTATVNITFAFNLGLTAFPSTSWTTAGITFTNAASLLGGYTLGVTNKTTTGCTVTIKNTTLATLTTATITFDISAIYNQ